MTQQFRGGREDCVGMRRNGLQYSNSPSLRHPFNRGQELVEFAFVFLILVLFIFGAVDLGRVFYTVIVVSNAAREGARYGIVYGTEYDHLTDTLFLANSGQDIKDAAKQEAAGAQISIQNDDIAVVCLPGGGMICQQGQPLRVAVTHNFTPLLTFILGHSSLLNCRAAEMMIP